MIKGQEKGAWQGVVASTFANSTSAISDVTVSRWQA